MTNTNTNTDTDTSTGIEYTHDIRGKLWTTAIGTGLAYAIGLGTGLAISSPLANSPPSAITISVLLATTLAAIALPAVIIEETIWARCRENRKHGGRR